MFSKRLVCHIIRGETEAVNLEQDVVLGNCRFGSFYDHRRRRGTGKAQSPVHILSRHGGVSVSSAIASTQALRKRKWWSIADVY
jgi:hypothetical protein